MTEVPQDLIRDILLLSPVKSLLRFRCVSKPLHTMIDSRDFINSHLNTSSENMIHRKLIFQDGSSRFHICDIHEKKFQSKPLPCSKDQVFGYCNGLVLLYQGLLKLALWNPSTRQYMNFPNCPAIAVFRHVIGSGLGYDAIDGYKAVLIIDTTFGIEFWMFGVRSYAWTRIQGAPYAEQFSFKSEDSGGMFADGGLYWFPQKYVHRISQPNMILAFDLRNETFSLEVPPPPVCSITSERVYTDLHVLEGRLCISLCYRSTPQADLYMRNKDRFGQFSWTQLYSIKEPVFLNTFSFRRVKVLGYLKRRDNILLDFGMEEVVSYDLGKKNFEKVELKKSPLWKDPILCIENLVSIQKQTENLLQILRD